MTDVDQDRIENQHKAFVAAREAAAFLDVKMATLYAYVSRGLIRSVPAAGGRGRLYSMGDLERLRARHDARSGHGPVAAAALRWGEPVLDSGLTRIDATGPSYRGRPAVELARSGASFESAAELLWTGEPASPATRWPASAGGVSPRRLASLLPEGSPPLLAMQLAVPALAAADPNRFDLREESELRRARMLIPRLAAYAGLGRGLSVVEAALRADSVATAFAAATGARGREATAALDAALTLCADHELNMSAFAARVTASAGADLYACIAAGLSALSGPRHGGVSDRVAALVAEAGHANRASAVIRERMRRGEEVPGFGHRLYREGDPRAKELLEMASRIAPRNPVVRTVFAIRDAMRDGGYDLPNLDAGLVALAGALRLAPGMAAAIFAVGRTAGWVAHALEQRRSGEMLRPRARYVGPE